MATSRRASKENCQDIQEVVPLGPLERTNFAAQVNGITAQGYTPLASALELAIQRARTGAGIAKIVLISDGKETCERKPCDLVKELAASGSPFAIDVIGLGIAPDERQELICIADAGHGAWKFLTDPVSLKDGPILEPFRVQENVELVVDASRAMARKLGPEFGGETALAVVKKALAEMLGVKALAARDRLALRRFGGPCAGDNTQRLVEFGRANEGRILQEVEQLDIGGDTAFEDATGGAAGLPTAPLFQGVSKRIVSPSPAAWPAPTSARKNWTPSAPSSPSRVCAWILRIVGLALQPGKQDVVGRIVEAAGGKAVFVANQQELDEAQEAVLRLEPIAEQLQAMVDNANTVAGQLADAVAKLSARAYPEARAAAGRASGEWNNGKRLYDQERWLIDTAHQDAFRPLYELLADNRQVAKDMIVIADALAARNGVDPAGDASQRYNALLQRYNGQIQELTRKLGVFAEFPR
ncbi:MAG: hypothetical protein U1F68_14285 [Gammaproteobacteria bacterium]